MGQMTLLQGDCLELMKDIPDGSVDLVLTDPPYRTITGGDTPGKRAARPKGILGGNRKLFKYQRGISFGQWMPEVFRVLKPGTHCYIFTNSLNLREMLCEAERVGFKLHNILVWEKNNCTPSQFYMKNCEYILFLRKGEAKWINNMGASKTVHQFKNISGKKNHPTEKPVGLLDFYIRNSSLEGDVVFDPFMGSGSTGIACINADRHFLGMELDEEYFEIAKNRIDEAIRKKGELT